MQKNLSMDQYQTTQYSNQGGSPVKPDSNLIWAILSTVLCCLPIGIYAIIRAANVDSLWAAGKYDEAYAASNDAKKWSIIGAVVGIVCGFIYGVCMGCAAAMGGL